MLLKNKKGFTLIELLIVVAIIGIVSPLIFIILVSGIEDYSSTTKYLNEQYSVMEVTRLIKQDVEEAKTITFTKDATKVTEVKFDFPSTSGSVPVPRSSRSWKFDSKPYNGKICNGLWLKIEGTPDYINVVDDLDVLNSKFAVNSNDPNDVTRLILVIKPTQLNTKKYNGRNVDENINTEFSVRYKNKAYVGIPTPTP